MISGLAVFVKEVAPSVKIIGVETEGANLLQESLKRGERVTFSMVNRFTEEVGIKSIGEENFRLCREFVDEVVTVTTDEICSAIKDVFGDTRSLMEPTGAISVAGAKKYARVRDAKNEKYVAVLAAANMDFDRLRFVTERYVLKGLARGFYLQIVLKALRTLELLTVVCTLFRSDDRERFMSVRIPETRGSFQRLYNLICEYECFPAPAMREHSPLFALL